MTEIELYGISNAKAGAQDAYQKGDKVKYPNINGEIYISIINNNVWEPNIYVWEKSK